MAETMTLGGALTSRRKAYLVGEYLVLFFGTIGAFTVLTAGVNPIPFLVVLGAGCVLYLVRQPDFDRGDFLRAGAVRGQLRSIMALFVVAAVLAVVGVAILLPESLFFLPANQPLLWAAIAVGYPLLSVYPQELIFRAFMFHRYAAVFGTGTGMVLASAAAFGFAHIIFGNWFAVVASTVGGVLFARRYARSRSLLATSIEHGLYGVLIFTVGLGQFVYHGG